MRIGIDLDNTIIDYNRSFFDNAIKFKFLNQNIKKNSNKNLKKFTKDNLLKSKNGTFKWEFLQGKVYGKLINKAKIFPGFHEFAQFCAYYKIKVFIISHKSKKPHFDNDINLREVAIDFLKKNNVIDKSNKLLKKNIFFCNTKNQKIKKINSLGCDYFIDDLYEILDHKLINKKIFKIHFTNNLKRNNFKYFNNWFDIKNFINLERKKILIRKKLFKNINKKKIKINKIQNNGNSDIFKVHLNKSIYIAKFYSENDNCRLRIKREKSAYEFLNKKNVQKNLLTNRFFVKENFSLLEYYPSKNLKKINDKIIISQLVFLKNINSHKVKYKNFFLASAACLSFDDIIYQINERFHKFKIDNHQKKIVNFVNNEIKTFNKKLVLQLKRKWPYQLNKKLNQKYQILSPSDFGLQNTLLYNKSYKFIDFEYFGWDDPAKLLCDIILHPYSKLLESQKNTFISKFFEFYKLDFDFKKRFYCMYYLLSVCWCLIIIAKIQKQKDIKASNNKLIKIKNNYRFNKAKTLLKKTISEYNNKKYANFISQ